MSFYPGWSRLIQRCRHPEDDTDMERLNAEPQIVNKVYCNNIDRSMNETKHLEAI
jgi:hypothetical protein